MAGDNLRETGPFRVKGNLMVTGVIGQGTGLAPAKPAAYVQTYATADRTHANPTATSLTHAVGTADGTVADVGAAFNQTTLNDNFKEFSTQVNALVADVADVKQLVNSLIDDFQSLGFLS